MSSAPAVELPPLPKDTLPEAASLKRPGLTRGAHSRPDLDPEEDPRHFPCPQCAADLEYAIGKESLRCVHCGYDQQVEVDLELRIEEQDLEETLERIERLRRDGAATTVGEETVRCEACSAEVTFQGAITSTDCAYCGQPVQRDRVHTTTDRIPVDGVLPFVIDKREAQKRLSRWIKKLWFAPGAFKRSGLRGRFEGVFLPYFSFDSLTFTAYRGQRGDNYTEQVGSGKNRRTVTRTRWSPASGKFQRFFDDVLTLGVQSADLPDVQRLEPWPLEELKPFRAEYLAGFGARTYDRELAACLPDAKSRMDAALRSEVRRRIGGDQQRITSMDTSFDALTYKHLLLPLWLMSYRFKNKTYRVVINATTGDVFGERPYSALRLR